MLCPGVCVCFMQTLIYLVNCFILNFYKLFFFSEVYLQESRACLVAQLIKNLPAMQETCIQSLGWEDPLEKGKATHSSILTWRIVWTT